MLLTEPRLTGSKGRRLLMLLLSTKQLHEKALDKETHEKKRQVETIPVACSDQRPKRVLAIKI